jgi:hypothetical protein
MSKQNLCRRGRVMATDLAVTVEDRPGVLAALGAALGSAGVNIEGVSGVAAGPGSVVHLLVADAAAATAALGAAGYSSVAEREVLAVDIEDRPGVLGELAGKIADAQVNVDLVYLATGPRLVLGAADLEALRSVL